MNSNTPNNTERPFGYWLKAVDRLMAAEFATAFEQEGLSRGDWRLLNLLDQPEAQKMPLRSHKLRRLAERGWITKAEGEWTLTDTGQKAKARLAETVEQIRARVSETVTDEEMSTTLASLEKIAVGLGWNADAPLPRKQHHHKNARDRGPWRHRGRAFARERFERGSFEYGGFEPEHSVRDRRDFEGRGCERPGFGHVGFDARKARLARVAFERGFDAGLASRRHPAA